MTHAGMNIETGDGKWDGVIRAFWRRIQRIPEPKYNNQLELPDPLPCEFRAHFATALLASPINSIISAMTETAKEANARAIADNNEIQQLRAKVAELDGQLGSRNLNKEAEYLTKLTQLQEDNAKLRETLITIAKASDNGIFIVKKNGFQ